MNILWQKVSYNIAIYIFSESKTHIHKFQLSIPVDYLCEYIKIQKYDYFFPTWVHDINALGKIYLAATLSTFVGL